LKADGCHVSVSSVERPISITWMIDSLSTWLRYVLLMWSMCYQQLIANCWLAGVITCVAWRSLTASNLVEDMFLFVGVLYYIFVW